MRYSPRHRRPGDEAELLPVAWRRRRWRPRTARRESPAARRAGSASRTAGDFQMCISIEKLSASRRVVQPVRAVQSGEPEDGLLMTPHSGLSMKRTDRMVGIDGTAQGRMKSTASDLDPPARLQEEARQAQRDHHLDVDRDDQEDDRVDRGAEEDRVFEQLDVARPGCAPATGRSPPGTARTPGTPAGRAPRARRPQKPQMLSDLRGAGVASVAVFMRILGPGPAAAAVRPGLQSGPAFVRWPLAGFSSQPP